MQYVQKLDKLLYEYDILTISEPITTYTPPLDRNTDGLTDKHDIHRYTPPTFLKRGEQKFFLLVDFL